MPNEKKDEKAPADQKAQSQQAAGTPHLMRGVHSTASPGRAIHGPGNGPAKGVRQRLADLLNLRDGPDDTWLIIEAEAEILRLRAAGKETAIRRPKSAFNG